MQHLIELNGPATSARISYPNRKRVTAAAKPARKSKTLTQWNVGDFDENKICDLMRMKFNEHARIRIDLTICLPGSMWLDLIEFGENLTRMPGTQEIRDLEPLSILSEMAEAAIRKKLYPNEPICAPDGRVLLP